MTNSAVEMTGALDLNRTSPHFSLPSQCPQHLACDQGYTQVRKANTGVGLSGFDAQLYHSIPAYDPE